MGATPQSALAVVGVPFAGDAQVEGDVRAMLQGALSVLEPAGCALVGGHTSEVSELCLGTRMPVGWYLVRTSNQSNHSTSMLCVSPRFCHQW